MLTDKQKQEREAKIGSSDAPIVCGVSSYKSPMELFYQLHGELPRYSDEETEYQRIGSKIEPVIAELVAEKRGIKIRRCATRRHPKHEFMVANLDFEIVNDAKGPGVLEIKNRSGERPWDAVPDDIALQVAHQLAVTNREWGLVGALFQFGKIETYEVQRDKELEEYLIEIEATFMMRVANGEPPTEAWTPQNIGILKKLYPTDSGKTIALPEQAALNIEGFLQAKKEMEAIEERKALYEGLLKEAMADASTAECPGYKLTWKATKAGQRFDEDRFKQEHPDLYAQYIKTVPGYRRFLIKQEKGLVQR